MSDVKLVKKWVAADGSEHDTKRAAEENGQRRIAYAIVSNGESTDEALDKLVAAGMLSLKVKQARKPRAPKAAPSVVPPSVVPQPRHAIAVPSPVTVKVAKK